MKVADLSMAQGVDLDANKLKPAVEIGRVLKPAVQPVEILGDEDVELARSRIVEHLLIGWSVIVTAADWGV